MQPEKVDKPYQEARTALKNYREQGEEYLKSLKGQLGRVKRSVMYAASMEQNETIRKQLLNLKDVLEDVYSWQ